MQSDSMPLIIGGVLIAVGIVDAIIFSLVIAPRIKNPPQRSIVLAAGLSGAVAAAAVGGAIMAGLIKLGG